MTAWRVYAVLAVTLAVLVLVQAFMAGRALFGSWSIAAHGVAGNITFGLTLALLAAAVLGRLGRHAIAVAVVFAAVLTTQIGLGYAGRQSADAAAWHVPNGVLAFGIAVYQLNLVQRLRQPTWSAPR